MPRLLAVLVISLLVLYPTTAGSSNQCNLFSGDELIVGNLGMGWGIYSSSGCPIRVK